MKEVFISYNTNDIQRASTIRRLLEANGILCWMGNTDIHASQNYTEVISNAIAQCRVFILVLSSHAQESVYVLNEFECAMSLRKTIVPVVIENFRIENKFEFHLRSCQKINAYEDWKGSLEEVLETVRHLLSAPITDKQPMIPGAIRSNREQIKSAHIGRKPPVRCPYCGCTVLKRKHLFVDGYLYPPANMSISDRLKMAIKRNERAIHLFTALAFMIVMICAASGIPEASAYVSNTNTYGYSMALLGCIFIYSFVHFIFNLFLTQNFPDVADSLTNAISNSGMKYCTFKCAECEEIFSILLPKDDKIQDRVEKLLDDKKQSGQ